MKVDFFAVTSVEVGDLYSEQTIISKKYGNINYVQLSVLSEL